MAAVLKKRALAEYSHVIQEETKTAPPPKKLRLIHRPKAPEAIFELPSSGTSSDIFQSLLQLQHSLPTSASSAEQIIQNLVNQYHKEKEGFVRAKLVDLVGVLALTPGYNPSILVDDILAMIKNEESHLVICQCLQSLLTIGLTQPQNATLHQCCLNVAKQHLNDTNHQVRCKSLNLLGAFGTRDLVSTPDAGSSPKTEDTLQCIVGRFTQDVDPRVRKSAFEAMLNWHQLGVPLDQSVYKQACDALTDDYEGVRIVAVKLVWILSQLYPESPVKLSESGEVIRLMDDGFAHICNMVNDLSMEVRTEAASRLGSLHGVSHRFLAQTLDKKLMSQLRRKVSAHERQRQHYQAGEWSTGQKWADDAPKEDVDTESISLMSSGACGAFVHGLEDEYMEVRNATIDSLCELATKQSNFAVLSQDFLVDMLNDEIQSVRLNALHSLRKISEHILLREDQLEIIQGVLQDASFDIREALHDMFCHVHLATKACLYQCILALLDNLKQYPQDRHSIWKCMRNLGLHHPSLTAAMVPDLLSCHPHFESVEPDVEDPAYISILILVFNAAVDCHTMFPLFPDHIVRHYRYLRDKLPDIVPQLELPGVSFLQSRCISERAPSPRSFLAQTMDRLQNIENTNTASAGELMELTIKDLEQIAGVSEELSASAQCQAVYLKCQLHLAKALRCWSGSSESPGQHTEQTASLTTKVLRGTHEVEQQFVGLGVNGRACVRQLRLRAHSLKLLLLLQSSGQGHRVACVQYLQILNQLQRYLKQNELTADVFTQTLLSEMTQLESCEPGVYQSLLQRALLKHRPALLHLENVVQQACAEIIEPVVSENPVKFTAGLTAGVDLIANLNNVSNTQNVRIKLKYPDQQEHLLIPRLSDFRQLSRLKYRLVTQVLVSHSLWSEPCPVELSLVMTYKPDHEIQSDREKPDTMRDIPLCKPVSVLLAPRPARR